MQMKPQQTSPSTCLLNFYTLKKNVWMHGGGLVKLSLWHTYINMSTYINTCTKEHRYIHTLNKHSTRFYSLPHTLQKFTQSGESRSYISLQGNNKKGDKSAMKQARETTEHYAQAAAHYPSLSLSRHTHTHVKKKKSVKTHHDNII